MDKNSSNLKMAKDESIKIIKKSGNICEVFWPESPLEYKGAGIKQAS